MTEQDRIYILSLLYREREIPHSKSSSYAWNDSHTKQKEN